jgi:hypothetical protein
MELLLLAWFSVLPKGDSLKMEQKKRSWRKYQIKAAKIR